MLEVNNSLLKQVAHNSSLAKVFLKKSAPKSLYYLKKDYFSDLNISISTISDNCYKLNCTYLISFD